MTADPILDDLFYGCALATFVEVCRETGTFPPDSEAVRERAYRYFEDELATKNVGELAQ